MRTFCKPDSIRLDVAQTGRVQGTGIGRRVKSPGNEGVKESLGICFGMVVDLSAQEAILGRDVSSNVDKTKYAPWGLVR
jgi:hypothetical protein